MCYGTTILILMSKSMIKSFAVMAVGIFALGFLVTTAITKSIFAEGTKLATIVLEDKSNTKNLTLCVNNAFVTSPYSVNPGDISIKLFYGDLKGATTCENSKKDIRSVYEETKSLTAGQTYTITATGEAKLTGVTSNVKTVLLSTTDIGGLTSKVSWKATDKAGVCVGKFLTTEDKAGSKQADIIHGIRTLSLNYSNNGIFCKSLSTDPSQDLVIDIKCGCDGGKLYEIGLQGTEDLTNAYYTGLKFNTKLDDAVVIPPTPEPTPSPKEETPTEVTPLPTPGVVTPQPEESPTSVPVKAEAVEATPEVAELAQAQTVTVRSGGNSAIFIAPMIAGLLAFAYFATKTKKLQIS